jgi:hypothetical protein
MAQPKIEIFVKLPLHLHQRIPELQQYFKVDSIQAVVVKMFEGYVSALPANQATNQVT